MTAPDPRANRPRRGKASAEPRRYRDPEFDAIAVKIMPGACYVTNRADEMIVTVLGSCVAACIRDPVIGWGGLNHFMLPESRSGAWGDQNAALRYGNFAMERLINEILKAGGQRQRLEIKLFGGASIRGIQSDVGGRNVDFVMDYLAAEGLAVAAQSLGGTRARRVHYFPVSGRALMLELRVQDQPAAEKSESRYRAILQRTRIAGTVELFS